MAARAKPGTGGAEGTALEIPALGAVSATFIA